MNTKKFLIITFAVIFLSCSKDEPSPTDKDIYPNGAVKVTWTFKPLASCPNNSYLLAMIDKDDKYEENIFFGGSDEITRTRNLDVNDKLEMRIFNEDAALYEQLKKISFDITVTDSKGKMEYKNCKYTQGQSYIMSHIVR
jgi:hypothetical protein